MLLEILAMIGAIILGMISFFMFWAIFEGENKKPTAMEFFIALGCLILACILGNYAGMMGEVVDGAFIRRP